MLMANSSVVTVRLHYLDPISGEWDWQDGIGAAPLQTDKDAGATDWQKIKSDAVMKSVPAAESYAIKDAAEKLGKLFGKDLNRADKILYDTLQGKFDNVSPDERIKEKTKELIDLIDSVPDIGLQSMFKQDCVKAKQDGTLTIDWLIAKITEVKKELSK